MTPPFTRSAAWGLLALSLAACDQAAPPEQRAAEVGVEAATVSAYSPTVALTGEIAARVTSELSFRVSGRLVERKVEVGDHVTADQVLATIDPVEQRANLSAAQASVDAADAKLRQAVSTFERQQSLIRQGFTTRREYDQAEEDLRAAQGNVAAAKALLGTAQDDLSQTVLKAGAPGIITARSAEAGEVVQSAQTVYSLAQDGPRDAVFYVYETIFLQEPVGGAISVSLVSDPKVAANARLREVSPVVDAASGTVKVKFEIADPPPAMALGAAVSGTGQFKSKPVIFLPWSALSSDEGKPAVWVVDPASRAASLRRIVVGGYEVGRIVVRDGLAAGQLVVSRGQQLLSPNQIVTPIEVRAP